MINNEILHHLNKFPLNFKQLLKNYRQKTPNLQQKNIFNHFLFKKKQWKQYLLISVPTVYTVPTLYKKQDVNRINSHAHLIMSRTMNC